MKLKYLIYKKSEFEREGVLLDGFARLKKEAKAYGVQSAAFGDGSLCSSIQSEGIEADCALALAARDETLAEAKEGNVAALALKIPLFPNEGLYQSEFLCEGFEGVDIWFLERVYQRAHGIPWRVIETKRCYLEEMTVFDLPELYMLYSGAGMADYLPPLRSLTEEICYVKTQLTQMYRFFGYGFWLARDRFTDELIGRAGFSHFYLGEDCLLEMGYAIAAKRRRQGYAFEICEAMLAYAKGMESCFDRVNCFVQEENKPSRNLLKKLGFEWKGKRIRGNCEMLLYEYLLNV